MTNQTQLWITFAVAESGPRFYMKLATPVLEWLPDWDHPSAALLGPGLDALPDDPNVPFVIPPGLGIRIYELYDQPEHSHEPFTDTESNFWAYANHTLDVAGTY